ncbi:MAG: GAP family protein [Actinobacteria bacterium]|nr:GAP family protein [Actinomycetota bacterium]MCB8997531.1 GAP family protein [Actinomycetota bacterium]MCB9414806.1 GAP family protein [Actinomycetota bacterium]MCB9423766.1 GAP family protein [Actinomycetota bacterium]HRY09292.1 GAP family protein [Candidatus Nanopelagicales bacterium]
MPELIIEVLPYAAGVFASPLPVIIAIVMLFTPTPRPTSFTYVATWVTGLTVVTVVLSLLAGRLEGAQGGGGWAAWVRIGLGVVVVAIAARTWLGRREQSTPPWLSALMDAGPREAVRYGVLMSAANPKELLMALAAALAIGASDAGTSASAVAIAVFVLVGAASVISPLVVFVVGGDATLARLEKARDWLQTNSVAVASGVLAAIGVLLVVGGLTKL